ncbi:hypothetical protein THAOC_25935 [Thalassiosira oceanica]|uniref:Uncharacterized protein n=1 Tax=Thalassiosira oceanica TaxID=159749 RepID=K0S6D1_THAOC|nr:hypothetical protein THAOC_25935 [Thalassiosira oceanica]|eukprot:EJK54437.1 hypothetical protein THAOC_25935 [Thalassiosira oceanica]
MHGTQSSQTSQSPEPESRSRPQRQHNDSAQRAKNKNTKNTLALLTALWACGWAAHVDKSRPFLTALLSSLHVCRFCARKSRQQLKNGECGNRIHDLVHAKHALYQLS